MVTLTTEGSSLKFTFQDSQHYLQGNGEIIAPKGSLALITDDTDMCNFVKADSNDIFVSVTYDELGMSKSEILSWFATNAGSSGGGGEGGLTPEEAQEMIDSSISGKADTSAVTQALTEKVDVDTYDSYTATTDAAIANKADESDLSALESVVGTKASEVDLQALESVVDGKLATSDFNTYSAATDSVIASKASNTDLQSVSAATDEKLAINDFNTYSSATQTTLNGKANASDLQALESVVDTKANASDLDALTSVVNGKADTTAMTEALASKLNISDFNTYSGNVDSVLATKANLNDIPDVSSYINSTDYDSANHLIKFFHNETLIDSIDATAFIKDGMVDNVVISGGNLVITFNVDAGKEAISIPLTDIFNPNNYYDKTATDGLLANKVDVSAYTAYTSATDSVIASKASEADLQSVSGIVDTKLATSDFNTYSASVDTAIASKADTTAMTQALADKLDVSAFETYSGATDTAIAAKASNTDLQSVSGVVDTKLAISAYTAYTSATDSVIASKASQSDLEALSGDVADKADSTAVTAALADKLDISDFNTYSGGVDTALQGKQATLTAGNNIDITNNVISVTGSTQVVVDDNLSSSSTNPVVNSAITTAIDALSGDVSTISGDVANKLDVSTFETYSGSVDTALSDKVDTSALTDYVDNTTFATYTGGVATELADKVDVSAYTSYTSATDTAIAAKADTSALTDYVETTAMTQALADKVDVSAYTAYTSATDTAISGKASQTDLNTVSGDVATLSGSMSNKVDTSAYTAYTSATQTTLNGKQNALTAGTNISIANDVISVTGISSQTVVELTQAQYDALTTKDPNTFYVITDASGGGVTIDPTLDSGSTNPVANSAITNAIDAISGDVATVSAATASNTTALGGYKLWKGTQQQYDAIVTKDESTIYFIVNNS